MKTIRIENYGDNTVVQCVEVAVPQPKAGEVLVKVHAAGVNPIDWKIRSGAGQRMGMTLPIKLGGELAGTIEKLGDGVEGWSVADAVYGIIGSGAFAEYAVAPAQDLAPKPGNIEFVQAAAIPLGALTAWQAMFDLAKLARGQRLLITNSAGGVGSLAVQLAKAAGAHVTAMASGRNEDYVRGLGADDFVDYTQQPFEDVVRDVDVVFDTVGGETFERAFATLRKGGFLVTAVAFPKDEGERYGVGAARVMCKPNADQLKQIGAMVETGKLMPTIGATFALEQIRDALDLSENGHMRGKIVMDMASS